MMHTKFIHLTIAGLLALTASQALADDWPQWMGPNRDMSSNERGLLKEWPEGGPPLVWLYDTCGAGYAGPAIVNGRLFILGTRDGQACLLALDAQTGDEIWSRELAELFENRWGDGPRSTPTVDGDRVYVMTARGALACCRTSDGSIVWETTMQDHGGKIPTWGFTESPLIDGEALICTPGGPQGAIVAFNKYNGEVLWKSPDLQDRPHYSSIVAAELNGQPQYVQLLPERLVGISRTDGALLWEAPWPNPTAAIPTPLVDGNRVYATTGYGVGCLLVEISPDNEVTEVYRNKVMKNKHGGVLLLDGCIYGHSNPNGWVCHDLATGKPVWRERSALGMGALGYADGMLYLLDQDSGEVALIDASQDGWQEHGRFTLSPQTEQRKPEGGIWVLPVIANGKLYLRDQEYVYCYDVSAK